MGGAGWKKGTDTWASRRQNEEIGGLWRGGQGEQHGRDGEGHFRSMSLRRGQDPRRKSSSGRGKSGFRNTWRYGRN